MAEISARERYRAVMRREPGVRPLYWEFGYWTSTVERWYNEGLRRTPYAPPPGDAPGNGVFAGALPFPHQPGMVRYLDADVRNALGLDEAAVRVPLNWRLSPPLRETILDEDEETQVMVNADGVKLRVQKKGDSLPQYLNWPVHDRASWEELKNERFRMDTQPRFPVRWDGLATSYRERDYPLGLVMDGFFAAPRELLGVHHQLVMYYDDRGLMHDINDHLLSLWLAMIEETVTKVDLDFVYVWEDMSFKNGPLISPGLFREFLLPYYRRLTGFLRAHGIDTIFVDTDGDCWALIPLFIEGGVTGMYPFEVQAGMDVVAVRAKFPQLLLQGGLDKMKVAEGKAAIDAELERKLPVLFSQGGYIPFCDHMVPPEVPWEHFAYYRQRIRQYAERFEP